MNMDKAKELYETYQNGNIADFKKGLNELTKRELIDFAYFVNDFDDGLYLCSKYLESD